MLRLVLSTRFIREVLFMLSSGTLNEAILGEVFLMLASGPLNKIF